MPAICRCFLLLFTLVVSSARADEPVAEFLQGLRQRGEIELAIDYIQFCRTGNSFSPELSQIFLLESGITFSQASTLAVDPSLQTQYREEARTALRQFLKTGRDHPRALQAQYLLGQMLLQDGTLGVSDPTLTKDRLELTRMVIEESRGYLEQSRDRYHELWSQYPAYIPEDQSELRAVKRSIEEAYIRTQLDVAQCTYWEAQTYPSGSDESLQLCAQAGLEFEKIHQRYRSQTGGLLARLWQARCFQQQNNAQGTRIALGIYAEILEHHGDSPTMQDLRDRALKFRLACLNTEYRKDYQLVIQEAEEWLETAADRSVSLLGLSIQWELCSALESKAHLPNIAEEERLDYLQKANARAYPLTWTRGIYAKRAAALMERVKPILSAAGRSTDPVLPPPAESAPEF